MSPMEIVSLIAMLLVSGGAASYIIQKVKASAWSSGTKYVLSVAVSAAVGLATAWLAGDIFDLYASWGELTAAQVFAFLGTVYATSTGWYELVVKGRIAPRE